MGYRTGHFYVRRTGACQSLYMYFPDGSSSVRDGITNAYRTLFGRYAEPGGMSFHISKWYSGSWSSYVSMVADTSMAEYNAYYGLSSGSCPPPVVYGCTDPQATNYNPSATPGNPSSTACTYSLPTIYSSVSPTVIVRPDATTFTVSWSISSTTSVYARYVQIDGSNVASLSSNSGSITISPSGNGPKSVRVQACNRGGCNYSAATTVNVYTRPQIVLALSDNPIIQGGSSLLSWTVTGDASALNIQPGIGDTNIGSYITVTPSETTTYTATVSHPVAGSGSDEIELVVYPIPSVELNGPAFVNYGESVTVTYEATNIPTSFEVTPTYYSLDAEVIPGDVIVLETGDAVSGEFTVTPPWDNRGPAQLSYVANVVGYGGQTRTDNLTIGVDIDQMPDYIDIPDSDEKIRNQQPVISPDVEVTTTELLVDDIDIPVEIRSDYPIQVQIDNDGTWNDVRQI